MTRESAVDAVRKLSLGLSPPVIKALLSLKVTHQGLIVRQVRVKDLAPGMILDEDVKSPKGIRLVPSGQEVTRTFVVSIADGSAWQSRFASVCRHDSIPRFHM